MHMGRRFRGTTAVLASLLLLFQLVMPMGNAWAAEAEMPTGTVETPAPPDSTTPEDTPAPSEETPAAETPAPSEETPPAETPAPSEETPPAETPAPSEETPAEPPASTEAPPATEPKTIGNNMLPPSNLAFQLLTPDDVKLTWSSVFGATGYNVYGIIDGELRLLGTAATNSFTFNDSPEGTHSFVVSTLSPDGESGPCAPVEVTVEYPEMQAPATVTSKIQNGNDIVLSWTASQYASTYHLYQMGEDGSKTLLAPVTGLTYTVSNSPAGTFTYAIASTNSLYGESALSEPVTIELVHPTMTAPGNVSHTVANGNDVTLKWDAVPFTTSYKLYQVIDGEKVLQKTITGATQTTLANLAAGEYAYVVHAFSDRFGESAQGGELSLTLVHPTMAAPANFKYTVANVNDVTLTWSAVPFATSYKVYQIIDGQKVLQKTQTTTNAVFAALTDGDYVYEVYSFSDRFGESATGSRVSLTVDVPTMQAPGNFTHTIANGNDIVLKWNAAANATSYKIYQVTGDQKVLKSTVAALTATFANQPAGEYVYEVHSVHTRYGESAEGSQVSFTLTHPTMQAPGNLTQTLVNGNDIVLKWDASSFANSYKVYQIVNGQKVLKSTVAATTATFANLPAGEYRYVVHAVSARFGESAEGSEVTIPLVHPTIVPPANAKSTINGIAGFTLSWDAAPFAASYKVYQVVNGTKTLFKTVPATSLAFTNMNPGDYSYVVHTVSARFGESAEGSEVSVTLNGVTMEPPTNLTHTIANGNDIVLKWTAAANATSYKVYQIIDEQPVLKSTVTATAATFVNMPAGEYNYEVRSVSTRYGESEHAATLSLNLVHPTVAAPTNLAYRVQNGNDVVLTWTGVSNANSYKVYEKIDGQNVLKQTVTALSATIVNAAQGDRTYVVHAFNTRFGESPQGAEVTFALTHPTMQAPGTLTHAFLNVNDINLKWGVAQYATSYKVYQMINGEKVLQRTVTNAIATTFVNMPAGDYTYVVHAYSDRFGESSEGSQVSFSLGHPTLQAPGTLTQTITNGNDITLRWGNAQYATAYKLYQIKDGEKVLLRTLATTAVALTNMPAGEYQYVVHAFSDRFGESPEGSPLSFELVHPTMQAPGELTQTIANGNDITLKWGTSQYATAYRLYQIKNGEKVLLKSLFALATTYPNMPEGEYQYVVHAYSDRFGESPVGSPLNFTLVHPTMQAPGELTQTIANGNDIILKWGPSQYATAYKLYQIKDGEKVLLKSMFALTTTYPNMPEGEYKYVVHSYSDRFGESPVGSPLTLDLVHPTMQAPGTLTQTVVNGNDIVLRWGTAQFATNYRVYQIVDGQKVLKNTLTGSTMTFVNMPEGKTQFAVHSYSTRFGESPEASTVEFDLVHPVVQPPVLTDTVININNITLSWNAVQWANEYRVYKVNGDQREQVYKGTALTFPIYNLSEATHTYEVTAVSTRFGESAASNRITETIVYPEMQAPTARATVLGLTSARISWNFVTYANGYNVYELVDGEPVLIARNLNALSLTLTNLPYKNHLYYVTSYSNSFGESDPSETVLAKLVIDEVAPVTTATAPTEWTKDSPVTVTLSATDNDTGVAKTMYSVNGGAFVQGTSLTVSGEGVHRISYYSVDRVDNKEAMKTVEVKIDQTAPVTTAQAPTGWSKDDVTLNLTATDAHSGVAKTYYSVNGSEYAEGTSVTVDREGVNEVSFYSVDATGNKEQEKTVEVQVDKTAPVTTSDAPTAWVKEDVTVTLASTDAHSGVAKTYYSVNGSEFAEGTTFTVGQEGVNEVSFYTVDASGNKEQAQTVEVKVDKTAPATTSNAPTAWVKEDITVTLASTDAHSGVANTYYSVNGSDFAEGTAFTVDQEGVHKVTFYSVDAAGNAEAVQTAEVKIDRTAPVVELNPNAEFKLGTAVKLSYTAKDSQSGIASEKLTVSGPQGEQTLQNSGSLTVTKPGVYTVTVTVTDKVGLTTTVKKEFVVYIPATVSVTPNVIKGNKGVFTVRVDLPTGFSTEGFDLNSVRLNGVKALTSNNGYYNQAKNGQFKFERSDFSWTGSEAALEFRGYVNGFLVVGQTTVKVQK